MASDVGLHHDTVRSYAQLDGWKALVDYERAQLVRDEINALTREGSEALKGLRDLVAEARAARGRLNNGLGELHAEYDEDTDTEHVVEGIDLDTWARHTATLLKGEREILRDYMQLSGFVGLRKAQIEALLAMESEEHEVDEDVAFEDMTLDEQYEQACATHKMLERLHGHAPRARQADDTENQ